MNIKRVEKSINENGYYYDIEDGKEILIEKSFNGYFGIIRNGVNNVKQVQSKTMLDLKIQVEEMH